MLSLFLAASALAAGAELPISVTLPAGASSPASLEVEWTDKDGRPIREERSDVRGGKLLLTVPTAGAGVRVVGGGFSSRAVAISDLPRLGSLTLEPTGVVEVSGLREKEGGTFLWIAAGPLPRPDRVREPRTPYHVRERLAEVQSRVARLELPIGKYVLAVDPVDGSEPIVFPEVQVEPRTRANLVRPAENGRSLTLVARDRDSRKPLRNAKVFVDPGGTPSQRLLQTIYQRRSGASAEDGRLKIGRIVSGEVSIAIGAPGRRRSSAVIRAGTEPELRDVLLAPFQRIHVSLVGLPRQEPRPVVKTGRCDAAETWRPCRPREERRQPLEEDSATIRDAEPGVTRVSLDWGDGRELHEVIDVSGRSDDADTIEVPFALAPMRFRGRTVLRGDRPVQSTVSVHGSGNNVSLYGKTDSPADGTFDLSVFVPAAKATDVLLSATTDSPRGRGNWYVKKPAPENYAGEDDIQIRILSGEFRVHLLERKTQTPVPHCRVQVRAVGKDGGLYTSIESDDDGVAVFSGIGSSAVRFVPQCEGYVHGTGENFDFDEGTPREETIFVDRSKDIVLTIVDRNGTPISGAHVQAQDVANYHGDNPHLHVNDYLEQIAEIGTSGPDGKLLVKGADWAEVPFFTIAPGKALTVARFPSMRSCEEAPECSITVALPSPNSFPGILLRASAGRPPTSNGVFFELGGIPIPAALFREAIALNGLPRDAAFQISSEGVLCTLPSLLADGDYDVLVRKRFDPKTGSGMLRIGRVRVPATERLTLTLPEDAAGPNQ